MRLQLPVVVTAVIAATIAVAFAFPSAATARGAGCVPHAVKPTIDKQFSQIEGKGWASCKRKPAKLTLHILILRYSSSTDTTGDLVSQGDVPIVNPGYSVRYPDKYIAVVDCGRSGYYTTFVMLEVFQPPVLAVYPHAESRRLHISNSKQCRR